jgi:AraC-like DNA-binding protein
MLIVSRPALVMPDGPLLSRRNNFAVLRSLLTQEERPLARQTLLLGNDYARIDAEPVLARGYVEFVTVAENLIVVVSEMDFAADSAFRYLGENWIRFSFNLSGGASLLFDGLDRARIERGVSHLMLHPEGVVHTDVYFARSRTRWVSILCRKEHLIEILGFDPEAFPVELKRFLAYGEPSLYLNQRPLNRAMHRCVTDMFRTPSVQALRPLYLKGKAYEALYAYLDDFAADTRPRDRIAGLTRRDIDRLHEARSLLDSDATAEIALGDLARRLGLNRSKLSRGFHSLFGTTILEYSKSRRLAAAYELLRDTELSVTQVAERCGYRHVSTFSAAFKSQFRSSPREMRAAPEQWRRDPSAVLSPTGAPADPAIQKRSIPKFS